VAQLLPGRTDNQVSCLFLDPRRAVAVQAVLVLELANVSGAAPTQVWLQLCRPSYVLVVLAEVAAAEERGRRR
jgi:hypothetical protein